MIVYYTPTAITKLNIDKFNYSTYNAIGVNLLKYLNDSSMTFRLLQCASDVLCQSYKNINYTIRFDYNKIGCNTIDAVNLFDIRSVKLTNSTNYDTVYLNSVYGYSKYTNNIYKLFGSRDAEEFTRYSYPCDIILTESASGIGDISPVEVILKGGVYFDINKIINNTRITLSPKYGFSLDNLINTSDDIYIVIEGLDTSNRKITETIQISDFIDYKSYNAYSFINKMYSYGNKNSITLDLFPYIEGSIEIWNDKIIDREYADEYKTCVSLDAISKQLLFSKLLDSQSSYPNIYDIYNIVDLDIGSAETIFTYFIDIDDELIYIITSYNNLYCFPLVIPYQTNSSIDSLKTKNQSVKVQYIDDEINEKYIFTIIPSSKTNDVESMNIIINDSLYQSDLLLDLYREGIEDNKIVIPYSDLFANNESIIRFETSGVNYSCLPIYLNKRKLYPLYVKDLGTMVQYGDSPPSVYLEDVQKTVYFAENYAYSTYPKYKNPIVNNFEATEDSKIYKFTNSKNIYIDNYKTSPVYNSFYFDNENTYVVTSDAITHIRFDNDKDVYDYSLLNSAIADLGITGIMLTGKGLR